MTSNRSYSKIREQSKVRDEFIRCSGTQFDPAIAEQMVALMDEDCDYLMNEKGYKDSAAAKHAVKLIARAKQAASDKRQEIAKYESEEEEEEEAKLPEWLENSAAVDTAKGIKNCGSVEGYLSMLSTFHATVNDKAREIEDYYNASDWENYTIKVHALKSSARIIGADELSDKAGLLEMAGDENDIDTIKKDTAELLSLYRSYREKLAEIGDGDKPDDDRPEAPQSVTEDAYQALGEYVETRDFELSRMVLDSMKEYRLPDGDRERFTGLQEHLLKLDWDGMAALIRERNEKGMQHG